MKSRETQFDKVVLFKRYDAAGKAYWCMTRVDAYKRYTRTIQPLNDLLRSLEK